jgi:uncharacterized membrane protein
MEISSTTDIFLIIAAVAVVFLAIMFSVLIFNLILFFRALKKMANTAEQAAHFVSEDLKDFSQKIKKDGFSIKLLLKFLFGLFPFISSKKSNKK